MSILIYVMQSVESVDMFYLFFHRALLSLIDFLKYWHENII